MTGGQSPGEEASTHGVEVGPVPGAAARGALVPIQVLLAQVLSDLCEGRERVKLTGQNQHLCQAAPDAKGCVCVCRRREVGELQFAL